MNNPNQDPFNGLEKSLLTETEYVPVQNAFDKSIGFSEKVLLPNAYQKVEDEYKRDLDLYKKLKDEEMHKQRLGSRSGCGNAVADVSQESHNEFLASEEHLKPSKWKKPNRIDSSKAALREEVPKPNDSGLKDLEVPMGESVKITDSVAQACKNSDIKLGKWKNKNEEEKR